MSTFDLIDLQDDFRSYQITFNLWKKSWEKNAGIENFEWKTCSNSNFGLKKKKF
jgi:hypothetical protein